MNFNAKFPTLIRFCLVQGYIRYVCFYTPGKAMEEMAYRKIASSRPVYYSILNSFGQRSRYISIKFRLHKQSENPKMCYNQDRLLLGTLQYVKKILLVESVQLEAVLVWDSL